MRYLTLAADYTLSPLRDDHSGPVVPEEVGLSWDLGNQLRGWNDRYRAVIPLGVDDRQCQPVAELIDSLDEEGLRLAERIRLELGDVRVRYFSEGHLRFLT